MMQEHVFTDRHGTKRWYANEFYHRLDGPAVESLNGYREWWVNGKKLSNPLDLLKHGANWKDLAEYLTPREIAKCRTQQ